MKEMTYFELFGRISDRFVTEALIPAAVPVPTGGKGFRQTPLGRFLTSPALIAVIGAVAAVAIAVAIGLGLAGQGRTPDTDTQVPPADTRPESLDTDRGDTESTGGSDDTHRGDMGTDSESESAGHPDETQDHPYVERNNYGIDMSILYGKDLMGEGLAYIPADMLLSDATALNTDLYERIQRTEDYLGIRIGLMEQENDEGVELKVGLMNQSGEYGNYFILASGHTLAKLGGYGEFLTPWDTLDAVNTESDYWDTDLMSTHTQGGHSYIAYNSFIPPNAYAIAYNKSLYATAPYQRDLYRMVEKGEWTVELLQAVLVETSSIDGHIAIHDYPSAAAYLTAVGFRVLDTVETEEGNTQSSDMAVRRESLKSLYLRAQELTSSPMFLWDQTNRPDTFMENHQILMDTRLTRDLASCAYDRPMGILPLPKYDRTQGEYLSLHVNAYMGLWCLEKDRLACGEAAELLAYFSRHSKEDYNRAVLGFYGKDDTVVQKELAMLRIIHDTTHDMGITSPNLHPYLLRPFLEEESDLSATDERQLKNWLKIMKSDTGW